MNFATKAEGALRRVLEDARERSRCTREALTVLQVDPYRLDTPANHRDGAWVAGQLDRAIGPNRCIHWRGLHYAIVAAGNVVKPNGATYLNPDDDWRWLSDNAGKAARWLGYVDFERITDNRNSDPIIHRKLNVTPRRRLSIELDITVPSVDDINPFAGVSACE